MPVDFDWGYFPRQIPAFPQQLTDALQARSGVPGFLGNCHASGVEIINRLGDEHVASGKPILYTSADSVFQIAAHEQTLKYAAIGAKDLLALLRVFVADLARRPVMPVSV